MYIYIYIYNSYLKILEACNGGDSCCTEDNKCGEQEGDCDKDSDCLDGLKCGENNCASKSGSEWDAGDDCCYKPAQGYRALHPKYRKGTIL